MLSVRNPAYASHPPRPVHNDQPCRRRLLALCESCHAAGEVLACTLPSADMVLVPRLPETAVKDGLYFLAYATNLKAVELCESLRQAKQVALVLDLGELPAGCGCSAFAGKGGVGLRKRGGEAGQRVEQAYAAAPLLPPNPRADPSPASRFFLAAQTTPWWMLCPAASPPMIGTCWTGATSA